MYGYGPPTGPPRTIAIMSWVLFVLGSLLMAAVTYSLGRMLGVQTCAPNPPQTGFSKLVFIAMVCAYLGLTIPLLLLLIRRDKAQDASALCVFLALGTGAVPFMSWVLSAFSAGMC
jgi:hypothetical protein